MPRPAQDSWSDSLPSSQTREWLLQPNQPSPQASVSSRGGLSGIYDSRNNPGGIGFPSANRALARLAPNDKDPHGYYEELGVARDATFAEIKRAMRKLFFKYHPDTGTHPNPTKLNRIKLIGELLLDPDRRAQYDRTPEDMRLWDAVYTQELIDAGLLSIFDQDEFEAVFEPVKADPYGALKQAARGKPTPRYDFLAVDHVAGDWMLANRWYHHLIAVSGQTNYRRVIKVMLINAPHPRFNFMGSIMMIPRHWEPSDTLAKLIFTKAGFLSA